MGESQVLARGGDSKVNVASRFAPTPKPVITRKPYEDNANFWDDVVDQVQALLPDKQDRDRLSAVMVDVDVADADDGYNAEHARGRVALYGHM
jgi:hypothetical protein